MNKPIRTGRRDWTELYHHKAQPRNVSLSLLVSGDERDQIDAAAKAEGITRSAWLTRAAIGRLQQTHGSGDRKKDTGKTHGSTKAEKTTSTPSRPTKTCVGCKGSGKQRGMIRTAGKRPKTGDIECSYCGGEGWVYEVQS